MNILNNIKNFLYDQDYFVGMYKDKLYIFNYSLMPVFNDKQIKINFSGFNILVSGKNLKIVKMEEQELLIVGDIKDIKYEK